MILSFLLKHLNWYFISIDQSPSHLPIYKTLNKHPQLTLATLHIIFTQKIFLLHFHLRSHFFTHYCINCLMALPKVVPVSTDSTLSSIIISLEEALKTNENIFNMPFKTFTAQIFSFSGIRISRLLHR